MWQPWLYRKTQVKSNPLRCIMQTPADRATFFENMSQAVAEQCSVFATVMTKDVNNIPTDGIWARVEFPTLQRSDNQGRVDSIDKCNPDASIVQPLWTRSRSRLVRRTTNATLEARDDPPNPIGQCGIDSEDVAGDFDEGTEYEVIW
jgi:hypothetical protein